MPNGHGGYREGAGIPKGFKFKSTQEKIAARKMMETRILNRLNPLLNSQFYLAEGLTHVFKIVETKDSKGKVTKRETVMVTDPEEIRLFLDEHEGGDGTMGEGDDAEYYFITTKAPDVRAIDSMIDRTFGKATQSIEMDNPQQNDQLKKINETLESMYHNVKSKRVKQKNT